MLVGALYVLWYLKPLSDAGLVAITNPATAFCEKHLPDLVRSGALKKIESALRREYAAHATIEPDKTRDAYSISAPANLLEHGGTVYHLTANGRTGGNGRRRAGVSADVKRTIINNVVHPIVSDILLQHVLGAHYGLQYLTDRDVDFLALGQVNDPKLQSLNHALAEGVAHSVPTLEQLPLRELLRLRREEGEVFAVYRDALARVLRTVSPADSGRVRQAFQDLVLPELNNIDMLVANEQKRLKRSATTDLFAGLAALSVALFTGVLAPDAVKVLTELGGVGFLTQSFRRFHDLTSKPEEQVRDAPYYFLWKVREHARRQTNGR